MRGLAKRLVVVAVVAGACVVNAAAQHEATIPRPGEQFLFTGLDLGCQYYANQSALACVRNSNPAGLAVVIRSTSITVIRGSTGKVLFTQKRNP